MNKGVSVRPPYSRRGNTVCAARSEVASKARKGNKQPGSSAAGLRAEHQLRPSAWGSASNCYCEADCETGEPLRPVQHYEFLSCLCLLAYVCSICVRLLNVCAVSLFDLRLF